MALVVTVARPTLCAMPAGGGVGAAASALAVDLGWTWRGGVVGPAVIAGAGACSRPAPVWPFVAVAVAAPFDLRGVADAATTE